MNVTKGIHALKKGTQRLGHLDVSWKTGLGAIAIGVGSAAFASTQQSSVNERAMKNQQLLDLSKKIDRKAY